MARIEEQSIFGGYSQVENRVTAALLQILKVGGTEFIGNVISQLDDIDFPKSEITIVTQEKEKNVYDGLLECRFAFRVLIESKVKKESINKKQLQGLIENAVDKNDYVVYITVDNSKPKELNNAYKKIYWANWRMILDILQEVNPNIEPLNFLIGEFEKFLDFLGLINQDNPEERVQIAAGSNGEPVALEYGFYACQNLRSSKPSKYLAFYNNQGIHTLFEIIGEPIDNYILSNDPSLTEYLIDKEPFYSSEDRRQFYRLKLLRNDLKITHKKKNKNGKNAAFTMGPFRYTTYDKLLNAKTTDDLL